MDPRQCELLAVIVTFLVLSWITVGLRGYVRFSDAVGRRVFGWDDVFIFMSLITFTITCGLLITGMTHGIGVHMTDLSFVAAAEGVKYQIITTQFGTATTSFIKTSVGLLLLRIISVKPFYKYFIYICIGINSTLAALTILLPIVQCHPIAKSWNPLIPGTCLAGHLTNRFNVAMAIQTIVFDWTMSLLPIPLLWGMKMHIREKLSVALVLSMGIVASTATIVRLQYITSFRPANAQHTAANDGLYDIAPWFICFMVELGLGIIAASATTLRPLLRKFRVVGFSNESDNAAIRTNFFRKGYHKSSTANTESDPTSRRTNASSRNGQRNNGYQVSGDQDMNGKAGIELKKVYTAGRSTPIKIRIPETYELDPGSELVREEADVFRVDEQLQMIPRAPRPHFSSPV